MYVVRYFLQANGWNIDRLLQNQVYTHTIMNSAFTFIISVHRFINIYNTHRYITSHCETLIQAQQLWLRACLPAFRLLDCLHFVDWHEFHNKIVETIPLIFQLAFSFDDSFFQQFCYYEVSLIQYTANGKIASNYENTVLLCTACGPLPKTDLGDCLLIRC